MIKNMKVGTILQTGFFVGSMVGASMAGLGVYSMHQMNNAAAKLYESDLMSISHIKEANTSMGTVARSVRSAMLAPTLEMRAKFKAMVEESKSKTQYYLAEADKTVDDAESRELLDDADAKVKLYFDTVDNVIKQLEADGETVSRATIELLLIQGVKTIADADDAIAKLTKFTEDSAHAASDANQKLYEQNRLIMLIVVMLSTLSGFAAGIIISRRITGQLGGEPDYAANIAKEISSGNLNVDVELRKGDTSSLLHAMKNMRDSLVNIVSEVRIGTDAIDTAAKQIADGNMDLSGRTEQQASSLEETAASMEELTSTVKQNADNARQANNLASSAATVAVRGGEVINEVVTTMGAINDASRKVVDIISVIDGIAFQTNILALNAAVEAARAGEQGRGFAVVASEVRALAQRSAAAAKEIKGLIATSVERVESGSALVDQAGSTMSEIVTSITRVNDIMSEISAASLEQTSGIEQVNEAVMQMDSTTQQNAALVEEAAAAAESLREQADKLVSTVAFFKLENSNNAARTIRSEPLLRPLTKEVATPNAKASPVLKPKMTPPARPSAPATVKPVLPKTKASSSMTTVLSKDDKEDWEEF